MCKNHWNQENLCIKYQLGAEDMVRLPITNMTRQVHPQASTDAKDLAKQMVVIKTAFIVRTVVAWRLSCSEAPLAKKLVPWKTNLGVQNFAAEPTIHVQNMSETIQLGFISWMTFSTGSCSK